MAILKETTVVVFLICQTFAFYLARSDGFKLTDRKMDKAYRLRLLHSLMNNADTSRRRERQITPRFRYNLPFFPLYEMDLPVCEDKERESKAGLCESWAKSDYCNQAKFIMSLYCPKTCKFCKQFSPPGCQKSKYGCCWNNSPASGPNGDGCPRCNDHKRRLCRIFGDYCSKPGRNGKFVRYHCFSTCGWCARFKKHKTGTKFQGKTPDIQKIQ